MFGRKKEVDLQNQLMEYKTLAKSAGCDIGGILDMTREGAAGMETDIATVREGNDNVKRSLAMAKAQITGLQEDLRKNADEVRKKEKRMADMRDAISDRNKFDTDAITRTTDKILDEIRVNDRTLNGIQEEMRSVESISAKLKDLAGRTSALSLNAAIMGAKIDTGEEGFVKTATEIKELAADCSMALSDLNRKVDRVFELISELSTSNAGLREAAGAGKDAATEFAGRYKEIYKAYAPKTWGDDDKPINMDKNLDTLAGLRKAIMEADSGEDAVLRDLDGLGAKVKEQSDRAKQAKLISERLEKIM